MESERGLHDVTDVASSELEGGIRERWDDIGPLDVSDLSFARRGASLLAIRRDRVGPRRSLLKLVARLERTKARGLARTHDRRGRPLRACVLHENVLHGDPRRLVWPLVTLGRRDREALVAGRVASTSAMTRRVLRSLRR